MLIKNIYVRLGSNFMQGGFSIIASILIVRFLGVDVIGKVAYYYGLVGMLTLFTNMGIGMAYRKFLTTDRPHEQDIAGYIFLKLILIVIFCLITMIAYRWFFQSTSLDRPLFFIAFVITVVNLFSQFFADTMAGRRDFVFLSKIEVIGSILLFLYNIMVCLIFPNIYFLALNMGIIPICLIIAGSYYCIQYNIFSYEKPNKDTLKKYFYYSYPISVPSMVTLFITHFEKVILGWLVGMKELGYYRLALGIYSGFDKGIKPVTNTLFTEISYRVNQTTDFIKKEFQDLVQILNMIGVLITLLLIFSSEPVVTIFYGLENIRTALILQCFSLVIISRIFWRPYRHLLYAIEAHHPLAYLSIIEILLRLGCYYLLMPLSFKGVLVGALAIPLTEFIFWIIPSGIYNVVALRKRFGTIHIMGVFYRIWLPFIMLLCVAYLLKFRLYLFFIIFPVFIILEYRLKVLTPTRWNSMLLPFKGIFRFSKV